MNDSIITFSAIDTWFFRESRPMESMGELQSVFPPSMRTLTGAVRSWIGMQENVDWLDFKENPENSLRSIIGSNKEGDLGALAFKGVWIKKNKQRLYPAPLHLLKKEQNLYFLKLAEEGITCDLGKNICLPELPCDEAVGSKPLDNIWVDEETLLTILEGVTLQYNNKHFFSQDDLYVNESRVGIARENSKRIVKKGLIYQTQHIRPSTDVQLEIDVTGLPPSCQSGNTLIRLGGESRTADLLVTESTSSLASLSTNDISSPETKGFIIYLLTPLQLSHDSKQPLPGFTFKQSKPSYWEGQIKNIELKLYGAVTGKTVREGGWDMAQHKPRTDKSLIPAGSVFFCKAENHDLAEVIEQLHNSQLGELQKYGYGQITIGLWK